MANEVKGISGEVTSMVYVEKTYPCIEFPEGYSASRHKFEALSKMVAPVSGLAKDISIYMHQGGRELRLGAIAGVQVKPFFELFDIAESGIRVHLSPNKELQGSMVYILSE